MLTLVLNRCDSLKRVYILILKFKKSFFAQQFLVLSLDRQACLMLEFYAFDDNMQYSIKYAFTICLNIDIINVHLSCAPL